MDLVRLLETAVRSALSCPKEGDVPRDVHHNRSAQFVEELASGFREHYRTDESVRVLSKGNRASRGEFGLNELLYDILVCATATTPSAKRLVSVRFIKRGIWAVESEFARDSRKAVYDFNKLVLAATDYQLFVGPQTADEPSFLQALLGAAKCCTGSVFVGLLPHPSDWRSGPLSPHLYVFDRDEWRALPAGREIPSA